MRWGSYPKPASSEGITVFWICVKTSIFSLLKHKMGKAGTVNQNSWVSLTSTRSPAVPQGEPRSVVQGRWTPLPVHSSPPPPSTPGRRLQVPRVVRTVLVVTAWLYLKEMLVGFLRRALESWLQKGLVCFTWSGISHIFSYQSTIPIS